MPLEIEYIDLPCSSSSPTPSLEERKIVRKSGKAFQRGPELCAICYGKATGHHYDVASCNGCKSFFRRVTIEKLSYTCQLDEKCYQDLTPGEPAPKCRACRFQRCVDEGMNHLGIQSEMRKFKKMKEKENIDSDNEIITLPMISKPKELEVSELIEQLLRLDIQTNKFRDCAYNPRGEQWKYLKESVEDGISMFSIADKMGPMENWPLSQEVVEEMRKPNPVPGTPRVLPENVKRWTSYDILIMVELTKTFSFFQQLSLQDRYILLRDTSLMSSNLTKSFFSYENKCDKMLRADGHQYFSPPLTRIPAHLIDRLSTDISIRCLKSIIRLEIGKVEFVLLRAILICNTNVPDLSPFARQLLTKERNKYTMVLLNYVMLNHGATGAARFASLLNIIGVLEHQQKDQRDVMTVISLVRPNWIKIPLLDDVTLV